MRAIRSFGQIPNLDGHHHLKPKACIQCKARKVRCDRKQPCENCSGWSVECIFPSAVRTCRRRKTADPPDLDGHAILAPHSTTAADEFTRNLRALLNDDVVAELHGSGDKAQIDEICDHLQEIKNKLQHGIASTRRNSTKKGSMVDARLSAPSCQNAPVPRYSVNAFEVNEVILRPDTKQLSLCWKIFCQMIDPLIKVLHQPTAREMLRASTHSTYSLTPACLMVVYGVCLASLSSMSSEHVHDTFGLSKHTAVETYRGALQHAVLRSQLASAADLATLQGIVLALSLDRFFDKALRTWAVSTLAARLSKSLQAPMPLVERELRTRLLYELWYLDYRAYFDLGHNTSHPGSYTLPYSLLNVNDSDLGSTTESPHTLDQGWTDISFSLVQFEVARTATIVDRMPELADKEAELDACEERIQSRYLSHCDGSRPIHWLAKHVAYVLVMEIRFKVHCDQSAWAHTPEYRRQQLFCAAIDILDIRGRVSMEPDAKQWTWLLDAYMQYWPLRFALHVLCRGELPYGSDGTWAIVERALGRWDSGKVSKVNFDICSQLFAQAKSAAKRCVGSRQERGRAEAPVPRWPGNESIASPPTAHESDDPFSEIGDGASLGNLYLFPDQSSSWNVFSEHENRQSVTCNPSWT